VNWFILLLLGEEKQSWSILLISPVADLSGLVFPLQEAEMQISGYRNDSALWGAGGGGGYSLICLKSPEPTIVFYKN
jgi:hypothetical protein